MKTSDKQQASRALDTLGNLRHALRRQMDARSIRGWAGSFGERKQLANTARKSHRAIFGEAWSNPSAPLDQSAGHLKGYVEVLADADKRFVPEIAATALNAIEDVEQALRSRLDGYSLFPITLAELTRRAGLRDVQSVTQQMDRADNEYRLDQGKPTLAKQGRGINRKPLQESEARQRYPYLHETKVKEFLASALINK